MRRGAGVRSSADAADTLAKYIGYIQVQSKTFCRGWGAEANAACEPCERLFLCSRGASFRPMRRWACANSSWIATVRRRFLTRTARAPLKKAEAVEISRDPCTAQIGWSPTVTLAGS